MKSSSWKLSQHHVTSQGFVEERAAAFNHTIFIITSLFLYCADYLSPLCSSSAIKVNVDFIKEELIQTEIEV